MMMHRIGIPSSRTLASRSCACGRVSSRAVMDVKSIVTRNQMLMPCKGDRIFFSTQKESIRSLATPAATWSDESMAQHIQQNHKEQKAQGHINSSSNSNNNNPNINPIPDFNDGTEAYRRLSMVQLLRATACLALCRIPWLVRHSESLLRTSRSVLGDGITNALMKATLFGHFCAGETAAQIQKPIKDLEKSGIGSILDYAAEDDLSPEAAAAAAKKSSPAASSAKSSSSSSSSTASLPKTTSSTSRPPNMYDMDTKNWVERNDSLPPPRVRVYDYESEAQCDHHVETFLSSIRAGAEVGSADGYAAVKVTALGNPKLLARLSQAMVETQRLFAMFDVDMDGTVSREEFRQGYSMFFKDEDHALKEALDKYTETESGMVDYITWSMMLSPRDLPRITAACRTVGPLAMATPTDEELDLLDALHERAHKLAQEAAKCGTRLLMDAEQARYQPAIDGLVLDLQRTYNAYDKTDRPVIYNTYQCYLKDVLPRLAMDVERSERFNYHFGAKLVRGAYMESERALAASLGYQSPIHDTEQDTHDSYNKVVETLLTHAANLPKDSKKTVEVMLATHNQESIEKAIALMNELGIDRRDSTVCFGQLYGMMDNLSYQLGRNGYRAYKYVPYGPVQLVMPYLIRRAHENSSIAKGAAKEWQMVSKELYRRTIGMGR